MTTTIICVKNRKNCSLSKILFFNSISIYKMLNGTLSSSDENFKNSKWSYLQMSFLFLMTELYWKQIIVVASRSFVANFQRHNLLYYNYTVIPQSTVSHPRLMRPRLAWTEASCVAKFSLFSSSSIRKEGVSKRDAPNF